MIGRLNHVAIAVPTSRLRRPSTRTRWARRSPPPLPQPEHGVTVVFVNLPNTKIELLEPLGENSPIASFLERNAAGGIHHICYEVDDILVGARSAQGGGRACAGRRRAQDRRARQARAVPASEGFQRHARRDRAGLSAMSCHFAIADLPHHLVDGAVRRAADRRAHAGRGRCRRSGHAGKRADGAAPAARRRDHDADLRAAVRRRSGRSSGTVSSIWARSAGAQPNSHAQTKRARRYAPCSAIHHRAYLRYSTPTACR